MRAQLFANAPNLAMSDGGCACYGIVKLKEFKVMIHQQTVDAQDTANQPKRRVPLQALIAALALLGMATTGILHLSSLHDVSIRGVPAPNVPLLVVLAFGGLPLVYELLRNLFKGIFGSDLLAGISIVASFLLHQYLAGALVVLMLSGGQALEEYAASNASSVLKALAKRMPNMATLVKGHELKQIPLLDVKVGDIVAVFPHALCPVDGTVISGHGTMDESYLTGEPYRVSKAPGTAVLSGSINGEAALNIRCDRPAQDSRYSKIMQVMRDAEERKPQMRRLADKLGAAYTPLALALALSAWAYSGQPLRFLAVLVAATPCPLLIAIPISIIGSISLAARMGIIIKDPSVLENISSCRVAIFDKTGTLTYGKPKLTEIVPAIGRDTKHVLALVASLEHYSKHPLASAILDAATEAAVPTYEAEAVSEVPGMGLHATINGSEIHVTGRKQLNDREPLLATELPPPVAGMECVVMIDGKIGATLRFRDEPRPDGAKFIEHLSPKHGVSRVMLVSGDRDAEVKHLAEQVGITEVFASQSPEQKLELVRRETAALPTVFLGDGINDAPALTAATVGIAFGNNSEITGEAADAVILDSSLTKVDDLIHIGRRMRTIALQSAVGGIALSLTAMGIAAIGHLTPVEGAIAQEAIDVLAVVNSLRAAFPPKQLSDYGQR